MTTHQQLLYHIVFSTKNRKRYLADGFREKVFAYMAGTCANLDCKALIVGGYLDHVHLLMRIPTRLAVADVIGQLKSTTSAHINSTSGLLLKFGWQDGYGAFTVSTSVRDNVYRYIANQVQRHKKISFESEYVDLLDKHEVEYDPKYVFD